jgi:hypothetical protein
LTAPPAISSGNQSYLAAVISPLPGPPSRPDNPTPREIAMRGILLWLIGIPIPIIILLYLFNVL